MDELNEANLDRLISKLDSQFENINDLDKFEYVKRIKKGLNEILDESFYKSFKNGYREMGNNYIDRNVIKEIAIEYREVVENAKKMMEDREIDRISILKSLEKELKETSFHQVEVSEYNSNDLNNSGYLSLTIYIEPIRGLGIFSISLGCNKFSGEIIGFDIVSQSWEHKQNIENYDFENHGDVYERDSLGRTTSVKHNNYVIEQEITLV